MIKQLKPDFSLSSVTNVVIRKQMEPYNLTDDNCGAKSTPGNSLLSAAFRTARHLLAWCSLNTRVRENIVNSVLAMDFII